MSKQFFHIVFYFVLLCLTKQVQATHMVGGEINYRCLGNNQYEIMVTVFRDCDTGVPWFDDPASIGVFDNNDSLIYDLRLALRNNDTLELNLTDPCLVAPPNVCIHTTTYIDTVTLPYYPGGYQIVYQRCCRNQDIVNIVSPTSSGATYSSFVSEEALLNCNSSAVFKEWPPVYVCQGVAFNYDHSALDADGDSIVYELCTPYIGATASQSMPQPPNNPPYNTVTWQPPYSVDNMLGGPDSLKIDSQTGLLTGTPDNIGVFVVGICAKEYRNGVLISTTRRDFQYVVGVCGRLVSAAFFAPEIQCDNSLIVNFQNNSTSLGTGYLWSFGDTTSSMTSTAASPSYIYPDTGRYQITLVADPNTLCSDTLIQNVYLQYESIITNFDVTSVACTDSLHLDITDQTVDTISNIVSWYWDFGNGDTASVPYPSTVYNTAGTYVITLDVVAANGCVASDSDTLFMDLPAISSDDTVAICPGEVAVFLNPNGNPNHQYIWSPAIGLDSDTSANPLATISGSQIYQVTVTASNGIDSCVLERSVTVIQSPPLSLEVEPLTITCVDTILLVANVVGNAIVEWSTDPSFSTVYTTTDSAFIPVTGITRWFVRATNPQGCFVLDTADVFKNTFPVAADFTYAVNSCDTIYEVQFTDLTVDSTSGAIVAWQWDFGDGQTSTLQNPLHQYTQTGNYTVQLEVTTAGDCKGTKTIAINFNLPVLTGLDTAGICSGNTGVFLNPNGNPNMTYQWSPGLTLSDSTIMNPYATPLVPTTYTVTITAINGTDTCVNIDYVHVNYPAPVTVDAPANMTYCGSTVILSATSPTAIDYVWSGDASFNTIVATGSPTTGTPLTFPFGIFYVRATDPYGCTATDFTIVQQNPPINAAFVYQSLGCSDSISIQFYDITSDTLTSPIVSWAWTTSSGDTSSLQNPIFTFTQSQVLDVTLVVTLANGCTGSMTQNIMLNLATIDGDTTAVICAGDSVVQLNQGANPNLQYQWSPAAHLDNPTAPSPIATIPSSPFRYTVTVTGYTAGDTCVAVHGITVIQAPQITIEVPKDTVICGGTFNMRSITTGGIQIDWSFNPFFTPVAISNISSFFVGLPPAPYDLYMFIRVTDAYGCSLDDTASVFRRDVPIPVDFATDILSCTDTLDVQFTNTTAYPASLPPASWVWNYGNSQTSNSYNGSHQYTGTPPFAVTLTATSSNGCVGQKTDTINYNLPTLNSADTIGLCGAASVQLNIGGNPNLIYNWSPSTGLDNPNIASPIASPLVNTTYTVTVTGINNLDTCEIVRNITIGVDSFEFAAMDDTLICTDRITLVANTAVSTSVEWALDSDFNTIIGQTNPLTINLHDSRWFYVRGNSAFGCNAIDSVFVEHVSPDIPLDFELLPLNCGDSLMISFNNLTPDSNIVSWNWDLGNGQTSTLQNPTTTYYGSNNYTVNLKATINSFCLDSTSRNFTLQIPTLSIPTGELTTCDSDSVSLLINTNPNLNYIWSPAIGLSDSTAANPTALPPTDMVYHVRVYGISDLAGTIDTCWLEDSIRVNIASGPALQLIGDTLSCDSMISLQAFSASTTTFDWALTDDFQTIINTTNTFNTNQSAQQQTYYVHIQDDTTGCETIDSIQVEWAKVTIDLNPNYTTCANEVVSLVISNNSTPSNGLTYNWVPNGAVQTGQGTDSVQLLPNTNGLITAIATNSIGCADTVTTTIAMAPPLALTTSRDSALCTSSLTIMATSPQVVNYQWALDTSFSSLLSQNSNLNTNLTIGQSTYYVQVTDTFGCQVIDSVELEYQPVGIALNSVAVSCGGESVQLVATNLHQGTNLTYSWLPNGLIQAGQGTDSVQLLPNTNSPITAIATNSIGCKDTAVTNVAIAPPLALTTSNDTLVCTSSLTIMATSPQVVNYQWALDTSFSSLLSQNSNLNTNLTIGQSTYYVQVIDTFGCTKLDSVILKHQPVGVGLDSAAISCQGLAAQLVATNANQGDTLTYLWTPTNAIQTGQGTDTVLVNPNSTTTYSLLAQNQYGCQTTAQTTVLVSTNNPTVNITADKDTVFGGLPVQLEATQQAGYTYTWQMDSTLSATNIFNPMANPSGQTTYYLTITDALGCSALDSIIIYTQAPICEEPYIFVPNAFTPDGDGYNDEIIPRGTVITEIYFVIYNRWGQKVFETNQVGKGWNGKYQGKLLAPDVYGYYVKCQCLDGNYFSKKGNITLIR